MYKRSYSRDINKKPGKKKKRTYYVKKDYQDWDDDFQELHNLVCKIGHALTLKLGKDFLWT